MREKTSRNGLIIYYPVEPLQYFFSTPFRIRNRSGKC